MLNDPLEAFANDDDVVIQNHDLISRNSCSNISSFSSSSNSHVMVDIEELVDDDNIKPPYPEDTFDDERQLVDEHDDHHHQDDLVVPRTPNIEVVVGTTAIPKISTDNITATAKNSSTVSSPTKQRRKRDVTTMRKAPQAPKRFKSSYICFFTSKQPEIKGTLGDKATVMEVSKKSAQMWKELEPEERAHWEEVASKDKERYMMEKESYCGPWQVPYKRARKDPSAPKVKEVFMVVRESRSEFLLSCSQKNDSWHCAAPDVGIPVVFARASGKSQGEKSWHEKHGGVAGFGGAMEKLHREGAAAVS
jgi:hypothetical protein